MHLKVCIHLCCVLYVFSNYCDFQINNTYHIFVSEAMNNNKKFGKVNRKDLTDSVQRALHCAKERLRKSRLATALRNRGEETEDED